MQSRNWRSHALELQRLRIVVAADGQRGENASAARAELLLAQRGNGDQLGRGGNALQASDGLRVRLAAASAAQPAPHHAQAV